MSRSLIGRLVVTLFIVGAMVAMAPGGGPAIAGAPGWTIVPSPNVGAGSKLLDVTATGDSAWAVGWGGSEAIPQALIESWNGSAWTVDVLPTLTGVSALYGVEALASGEAWAVGKLGRHTLVLRWQGGSWQVVPSPSVPKVPNRLLGVSALTPTDAWAVGKAGSGVVIEHWNGIAWSLVGHPAMRNPSVLSSVVAVPNGPVWAVGAETRPGPWFMNAVSMRWTGTRWIRLPVPLPRTQWPLADQESRLEHVTLAGNQVWTAGWYTPDPGSCCLGGIMRHWRDGAWQRVHVPEPPETEASMLLGIGGPAPDWIWAVGMADIQTYAVLRSGPRWQVVDTPNAFPPSEGENFLLTVDCSSAGTWAVGYSQRNGESQQALILQYQG